MESGPNKKTIFYAKNLSFSWAAAFSIAFCFRFLTLALYPNDCLSTELFQTDEFLRPLLVYIVTFASYILLDKLRPATKRSHPMTRLAPKLLLIAGSIAFESVQTFFPLVNGMINLAHIYPATCFLGSVEDIMMDSVVILLFKAEDKR
jgi:hypothetical protein